MITNITRSYLLADVLKYFDPIYLASFGKCSGEAAYNAYTPYNQWWLLNLIIALDVSVLCPLNRFIAQNA
jgi:cytochrome c biogenesis protein ResB